MQDTPSSEASPRISNNALLPSSKTVSGLSRRKPGTRTGSGYGALKRLEATAGAGGKSLRVDTDSDTSAADEAIIDTNKRFRKFLDATTGFSTKERVKRAKSVEGE